MREMRETIFISHRSIDEQIAEMIKDFLVAVGLPNQYVFCSSLPGNDINEKIGHEVRDKLHNSVVDILILSEDYYKSPYCLNEAGVAWYQDDVVVIPIGLPEIEPESMVGFLNSDYKLRRLDNDADIAYIYDKVHKSVFSSEISYSVVTQEVQKLKRRYKTYIEDRSRTGKTADYPPVSAKHLVEMKRKIESIIDTSRAVTGEERKKLAIEPWQKFKCNNVILRDESVENPDFGNGLIKREPFNMYDEGILVVNPECEREVKVKLRDGTVFTTTVYVVDEVPYRNITEFDEDGSVNNPYPTFYCRFKDGSPFSGKQFIDKQTAMNYKESQFVE